MPMRKCIQVCARLQPHKDLFDVSHQRWRKRGRSVGHGCRRGATQERDEQQREDGSAERQEREWDN